MPHYDIPQLWSHYWLLSPVSLGEGLEPNLTSAISSKVFWPDAWVQVSKVVGEVFVVDKVVVVVEASWNRFL